MNDFDVVTGPAPSTLPEKVKAELAAREVPLQRAKSETSAPAETPPEIPALAPSPPSGRRGSRARAGFGVSGRSGGFQQV
jgi:hypothetical protein